MAIEEYRAFFGLVTNPNPLSGVPKGALSEANNVILQRSGIVSPRPGFTDATFTSTSGYRIKQLIPYDGGLFAFQENGSGNWLVTRVSDSTNISTNIDFTAAQIHSAEAGLNLYVTADDSVRRLESATDTSLSSAGVPEALPVAYALSSAGSPDFLADNKFVGFQVLYQKTINNRTLVGAPSLLYVIENDAGATRDVTVTFPLPGDIEAGDVWQLYRTPISDSEAEAAGQEPFLCFQAELTSTDISAGEVSVTHNNGSDSVGPFIYTAASQEGIAQTNFRPPKSKDVALFKDMLFYANATELTRQSLTLDVGSGVDSGDLPIFKYNAGSESTSDAHLLGATTITGLNFPEQVIIGGYISDANDPTVDGTYFAARTLVTATPTSDTLTIDTGLIAAAGSGFTIYYFPIFTVGGQTYYGSSTEDAAKRQFIIDNANVDAYQSLVSLATVINKDTSQSFYAYVDSAGDDVYSLRIESRKPNAASTTITTSVDNTQSTDGNSFIPIVDNTTGITITAEENTNRVYYSKLGEYEAVPLLNFFNIGSQRDKILRIIPTSDTVHIFTTRGHYKVYGTNPTDLIVEEGDLTLDLLNPNLAVLHDDAIFAFTSQGFVAVTPQGVQNISDQTIDNLIKAQLRLLRPTPYAEGCSAASKQTEDLVLFGIPSDASQEAAEKIYCFSTNTNGWTTWSLTPSAAVMNPADEQFYLGGDEDLDVETPTFNADQSYSITINSISFNTITIAGGSGWTPVVGDVVIQGGTTARVISVSSSTVFNILQTGGSLTTGGATAYDAFTCTIAPTVELATSVSLYKHYRDMLVDFRNRQYLRKVTTGYTSNSITSEVSIDIDQNVIPGSADPRSLRLSVPRSIRRAAQLYPKVTITEGGSPWELSGLTLIYEPVTGGEKGYTRGDSS